MNEPSEPLTGLDRGGKGELTASCLSEVFGLFAMALCMIMHGLLHNSHVAEKKGNLEPSCLEALSVELKVDL
jgi:hypothetical protein